MLSSLSSETLQFYHDPGFLFSDAKSYLKMRLSLFRKLSLNALRYRSGSAFLCIIAENNAKETIGLAYLGVKSYGFFKTADFGLVVKDGYQGRGVGSSLMNYAVTLAKNLQVNVVRLSVVADNIKAVGLYRKFGFVIEGHHIQADVWNGQILDTYSMALHLNPLKSTSIPFTSNGAPKI
jgi:RimJ/RimL family protein N-acetyltransferase